MATLTLGPGTDAVVGYDKVLGDEDGVVAVGDASDEFSLETLLAPKVSRTVISTERLREAMRGMR